MNQNGSGDNGKGYYRSRSRSPVDYDRDRDSSRNRRRSDSRPERRSRAPSDRRVYVANVPFDCKWTDIKDLFRDKVGDVSYVELFEDENGKFRGCGIVELKDKSSVPKAIEVLHRYEMKGRFLVVKEDFDVERDRFGRPIPRGRSGGDRMMDDRGGRDGDRDGYGRGGGGGGVGFNTYGLSPQFLDSLGIVGPLSNRVFVANLDYKVTAKKLQEVFRIAGRVSNVDLRTDKEGNSKGHGIVEFEHPIEAVQAISMLNGQKLFNRAMSVRMDKYNEDLDGGLPSKLPTGLQGIGKGLGAGGNPLQMTAAQMAQMNMTGPVGGMPMAGVNPVAAAAGMGLGGLGGMGLGAGALGAAGTGGLGAAGAGLGGMGSAGGLGGLSDRSMLGTGNLMGGAMASPTGLMGGLSGGLGGGSSALGAGNGGGLDYDRSLGGGDGYRSPRSSDAIMVQNLPMGYSWQNLRDRFREAAPRSKQPSSRSSFGF